MVRIFVFGVSFIAQAIEIVLSIAGLIAAVVGAGIALVLCGVIFMGIASIFIFFLALLG